MKTTYEKWIEANHKLNKCFESVSMDKFKTMSDSEQKTLCKSEKDAVANFLTNNSIGFKQLLQERIDALNQ